MTEAIVDTLEAIQINKQQTQLSFRSPRAGNGGAQTFVQQQPVGQLGQRIVVRQIIDFLLIALDHAHIREHRHIMTQLATVVLHADDVLPLRIDFAVLAPIPDFPGPAPGGMQLLPELTIKGAIMPAGGKHARLPANHLGGFVAGDLAESIVDIQDGLVDVTDQHPLTGAVEHHTGLAQALLTVNLLGNITQHAHQPHGATAFVAHCLAADLNPAVTILPANPIADIQALGVPSQMTHQLPAGQLAVLGIQQLQPVREQGALLGKSENFPTAQRDIHFATGDIPVPETIVAPYQGKIEALLTASERLFMLAPTTQVVTHEKIQPNTGHQHKGRTLDALQPRLQRGINQLKKAVAEQNPGRGHDDIGQGHRQGASAGSHTGFPEQFINIRKL